ncbi:MAG: hypothetical protein KKH52_01165 [Nanoarchaeota archaeon]|nr:hypothetical protein [Nanoarchaeota archaeon]MBU1622493.1 hypothetical protein [Nanoarchaeota archaeon]MBU1973986.1 hypothetical protein [Nanoarchaeota archaeon]
MNKIISLEDALEGVLFLHSETGTEGGYWAFQDSQFISPNTTRYSCKKCCLYWDKETSPSTPPIVERLFNGLPDYCSPNDHEFKLICKETWDYKGLHILENGDYLTIYHPKKNKTVWSGVIALEQHPLFTENASGFWIHADQIGIERDVWAEYFFKGYHAKLVPAKEHK